jgi:hypothetical protein
VLPPEPFAETTKSARRRIGLIRAGPFIAVR